MENNFFLTRIRRTNGVFDKGVEIHTDLNTAKGAYYAYLGAFGYGRHEGTDFAQAVIMDMSGAKIIGDTWKAVEPEPEPEA